MCDKGSRFPWGWERTGCDSAEVRDSTSRSVTLSQETDSRHRPREDSTHVTTVHNQGTALCEFTHSLTHEVYSHSATTTDRPSVPDERVTHTLHARLRCVSKAVAVESCTEGASGPWSFLGRACRIDIEGELIDAGLVTSDALALCLSVTSLWT